MELASLAEFGEGDLIEAERFDRTNTFGVSLEKCLTPLDNCVVDSVPVAPEIFCDFGNASGMGADLVGHEATSPRHE